MALWDMTGGSPINAARIAEARRSREDGIAAGMQAKMMADTRKNLPASKAAYKLASDALDKAETAAREGNMVRAYWMRIVSQSQTGYLLALGAPKHMLESLDARQNRLDQLLTKRLES